MQLARELYTNHYTSVGRLSNNLANSYLVRKTEDFAVVLEKPCKSSCLVSYDEGFPDLFC